MKKQSLIKHSFTMMIRNRKSYFLLSITIVLSFAILAGFLLYTDSSVYNRYKTALASPPNIVMTELQCKKEKRNALINMAKIADPNVQYYPYISHIVQMQQYSEQLYTTFFFMPQGNQTILVHEFIGNGEAVDAVDSIHELEIVTGRKEIYENEAIINENLYRFAFSDRAIPFKLSVPLELVDGTRKILVLNVVGICKDSTYDSIDYDFNAQKYRISSTVYCLQSVLDDCSMEDLGLPTLGVAFSTDSPEKIIDCAKQLGFVSHSAYAMREEAIQASQNASETKLYISIMLLLILGINLFGCFENALNDRKYEIGIKRAIGASGTEIVFQFVIEGMCVMIANILFAITLVSSTAAIYKLYRLLKFKDVWTAYLTSYSAAMFCVCSVSMSILFSILFSIRSSRVEIAKFLKAE